MRPAAEMTKEGSRTTTRRWACHGGRRTQISRSMSHSVFTSPTLSISNLSALRDRCRSFFALSKRHHPDRNPDDPAGASERFVRLAAAYAVLGSPEKRAAYDRDVLGLVPGQHEHRHRPTAPAGSYHSTSVSGRRAAGGRPASGLSARRTAFRGPPPSFYRSGAWRGSASPGGSAAAPGQHGAGHSGTMPGMGPGQDPFGHGPKVPHFDHVGHERTQRRVYDERHHVHRRHRHATDGRGGRQDGTVSWDSRGYAYDDVGRSAGGGDFAGRFLVVSGIVLLGMLLPAFLFRGFGPATVPTGGGRTSSKDQTRNSGRKSAA